MQKAAIDTAKRQRLSSTRRALDRLLDHYNPGERLSWWVSDDSFEIPAETIGQLREVGPPLHDFFRVANLLIEKHRDIRRRLEKTFTPNYRLLNESQPHARPRLIRPDVVCDAAWTPKLVELEITVGARADTAIMAKQYGLPESNGLIRAYADMALAYERQGKTLALVTAPHPFFLDLPDDAKAFAALLREAGVRNLVVLTEDNLAGLRFDGRQLTLNERFSAARPIHVIDRFIDIYEIAELQHPGMAAILDAYLAGAIEDVNTCKQNIDEKDWMSLFWEPRYRQDWIDGLGQGNDLLLQRHIPRTWLLRPDLTVRLEDGEEIPLQRIHAIEARRRNFAIKESGTSTTASGAQSFHVLSTMDGKAIAALLEGIFASRTEYVLQELIESPRVAFTAIDPEDDRVHQQSDARVKLSPFYLDGKMTDIRFVASNRKYAVNDEACVVGVVNRR